MASTGPTGAQKVKYSLTVIGYCRCGVKTMGTDGRTWRKSASSTNIEDPPQPRGTQPVDCCLGVNFVILSRLQTCLLGDHCLCTAVKGSQLLQGGSVDGLRMLTILLWALLLLTVNIFTQAKFKVRNPCGICTLKVGSQSFKCETWSQARVWSR